MSDAAKVLKGGATASAHLAGSPLGLGAWPLTPHHPTGTVTCFINGTLFSDAIRTTFGGGGVDKDMRKNKQEPHSQVLAPILMKTGIYERFCCKR